MVVHVKTAKRLDHAADMGFMLNYLIQRTLDLAKHEGSTKEVDDMLEIAMRHQKLAKADSVKFWQLLSKLPKGSSFDIPEAFSLTSSIDSNIYKTRATLNALLQRYPTNPRILRAYARFNDEILNDGETANQALIMAEQAEELKSKKMKHATDHSKRRVEVGAELDLEKEKIKGVTIVEMPDSGKKKESQLRETHEYAESVASSSVSAASSIQSEEILRGRFYRRHIDGVKLKSATILQIGIIVAISLAFVCCVVEFQLIKSFLSEFKKSFLLMEKTIRARSSTCNAIYYVRHREVLFASNSTNDLLGEFLCKSFPFLEESSYNISPQNFPRKM